MVESGSVVLNTSKRRSNALSTRSVRSIFPATLVDDLPVCCGPGSHHVLTFFFLTRASGINGESSFEAELLEKAPGCQVWGYDFSVSGVSLSPQLSSRQSGSDIYPLQWGPELRTYSHRANFEPWALGPIDNHGSNVNVKMWSLRGLMEHNGHDFIDILKVDIEGAEFASLATFFDFFQSQPHPSSAAESPMDFTASGARYDFAGKPLPIGQLQIELHPRESEESAFVLSVPLRSTGAEVGV